MSSKKRVTCKLKEWVISSGYHVLRSAKWHSQGTGRCPRRFPIALVYRALPSQRPKGASQHKEAHDHVQHKTAANILGVQINGYVEHRIPKDRRGSSLRILGSLAAPWNLNENSQTSESTDSAVNLDPEEAPTPCFVWSLFVQATHRQPWRLCANCPNPARHSVRYDPL